MSAKIRLLKTNIIKNKSARKFFKTMSSKYFHKSRSPKIMPDFTATKTTKFSDNNNLTNDIPSPKFRLSKNEENPLFIGLEDFHKKFILSKNKSIKINSILNYNKNKVINLKKYPLSPSIVSFSSESNSRTIPLIKSSSLKDKKNSNGKNKTVSFHSLNDENNESNNKNIENIFNEYKRNKHESKMFRTFQNNKIKSKLLDSNIINPFKTYNIFNTYNNYNSNNNINKNKINLISEFSLSEEIEKNTNNKINNYNNTLKEEDKIKIYYGRNNPKLMDKYAYPNYFHSIRIETNPEFFYKTKIIIFNNYRKYLNDNAYLKHIVKKNFEVDQELMQERNIKLFKKILTIYENVLEDYMQFLHKKYQEMKDKNEYLIKDKYQLESEIKKIKLNIMRGMSRIREGFSIKYFLTCVKNHTLSEKNFKHEDLKEIQQDRLKLNENYYLPNRERQPKRRSFRKSSVTNIFLNNNQIRKIQDHSLTKKYNRNSDRKLTTIIQNINVNKTLSKKATKDYNEIQIPKRFHVLNTIDEFFEHLDLTSSKVYNLIMESNDKYITNAYLKIELENLIRINSDEINHSNYLKDQIDIYEKRLQNLKSKNNILLSNYTNLKNSQFQRDVKFLLVIQNIHKIYSNIKQENKESEQIIDINKEMVITFGERIYIEVIENFFNKILTKVNIIKKRIPQEYKIFKAKFDRRKKKKVFYNYQRLLAQKIQIKLDKVLQKAEKIIYKPYKKTNDYKIHKKHKVIKKEVKKTDLEIFAEYLDDNSF